MESPPGNLTALSDSDNGSSVCYPVGDLSTGADAEAEALRRLSNNLASLFDSADLAPFADAFLVVENDADDPPKEFGVHRCLLSARSPFFRDVFSKKDESLVRIEVRELVPGFRIGYESLGAVLVYLYSGKVGVLPKGVCVCVDPECSHVGCRPVVDFMVEALFASFVFQVSELVNLFQRHLFDVLDKVAADDMLVVLSAVNSCDKLCDKLLAKCIEIIVKSDLDVVTLEKALPAELVKQITDSRISLGLFKPESLDYPNKHVKRIHRALDSDDIELVQMLLKEGHATLDDAYALHYAVAHCDFKITKELLEIGLANINHKDIRGYTVLHIAAMRKEPQILVSLLTKGAQPSDLTSDGRTALQISQRLTRFMDYTRVTEKGKASHKGRLCVEILELAERREPLLGEASVSLAMASDDLRIKLLYLENRVALARMLFPREAKVAMEIAQVDGTLEFTLGSSADFRVGNQRTAVDLNDTPFEIKEEHLARMQALTKTVALGKRFFPRCSEVLNKIMDDEVSELYISHDTTEERKRRYVELQDILKKAFSEDKEEFDKSGMSSSSSSSMGIRTKIARR
ncbi:BTB/POZ domain and ankyrin repeat-containing protein NPR1 [Dioscorea cayenensis subsp. rotundata]|uniref:BTB/POZ domain and ankyrin repeat-containing protein NPR1 n=1 Tax=Dioscorea cayennensis subsp. rotundata TaxID=55577 RepID=A0AB40CUP6_DIOCR|nr:BTB/POZ domain and ankyrin repeat-containing protein NPR1 [Dioscorea cayenensis subsp. rotundata]